MWLCSVTSSRPQVGGGALYSSLVRLRRLQDGAEVGKWFVNGKKFRNKSTKLLKITTFYDINHPMLTVIVIQDILNAVALLVSRCIVH